MALKRIQKEKTQYLQNQMQGVSVKFDESNPYQLYFTIEGPIDTPYYGGQFNYKLIFPPDYPFKPMKITSLQKVYHYSNYTCIIERCNCCSPKNLQLRKEDWSYEFTFYSQIKSIQQCFYTEQFTQLEEVCTEQSKLYKLNREQFNFNVKSQIASEKAKQQILQFIAFQRFIKQFISINSDSVFVDLFF
ncbi:ubiquitin-conjugating enzyme (macronuclear) [Tetrahymena thermophila SB210]|uniref:Ubiquitin-conjugating enzyme n=1 Tax=Tetrahymena thermophila (strain SB210) TaxID=312017 RepID=I7ML29_TETTS|nr:ubiquitin-conjugating enzyme [Tetrahymena thermophila SB210]EAS01060.1 ubiquitin-conjugating enzyme [Tetrahymena thermophila SB210]|eukprot:XP_001021305.1 ubiquitin-conjugating enzyme [Tetrahymena thermophila SB210]